MFRAKEIFGDTAYLMRNVPIARLCTGTSQDMKECCRKLIEVIGKGGYVLAGVASLEKGNPENIHTVSDAAFEYGVYTK